MVRTRLALLMAAAAALLPPGLLGGSGCSEQGAAPSGPDAGAEDTGAPGDAATDAAAKKDAAVDAAPDAAAGTWVPVPGLEACAGERLVLPSPDWPKRMWSVCGPGCLASPATYDGKNGGRGSSAARWQNDTIYLRTAMSGTPHKTEELIRVSDGAVLVLLRYDSKCYSSGFKDDAPFNFAVGMPGASQWVGVYDEGQQSLVSSGAVYPNEGPSTAWFSIEGGWGGIIGSNVKLNLNPSQSELVTISSKPSLYYGGRARNGLAVWVDWATGPTRVESWTKAGGTRTLFQGPGDAIGLALGDERIAWLGVYGPNTFLGGFDKAQVYWSPFTSDPEAIEVTHGPDLTGLFLGSVTMTTAGDFIALGTAGDPDTAPAVYVIRVSTKEVTAIPMKPGRALFAATMTPTELVLADAEFDNATYFQRWLRFDLAHLPELSAGQYE